MPGRVLVTGGAGFLGSHLCDLLLVRGHSVLCVDNLCTGSRGNVEHLLGSEDFDFVEHDICEPLAVEEDLEAVFNLACPASPLDYARLPLETLRVCADGTANMLSLAEGKGARFLQASTSEVYGDPEQHPQNEDYWGHVNPAGPRSMYDEGKRYAEALCVSYARARGVDVHIARIFNSYGPRMRRGDGRVVPAFIEQAIKGLPLTVFGDGSQTRSFCYCTDTVEGLYSLCYSAHAGPVNIGNPVEMTVLEFAEAVKRAVGSSSAVDYRPLPTDDPARRRPDIGRARELLGWEPRVGLDEGLPRTVDWFRRQIS